MKKTITMLPIITLLLTSCVNLVVKNISNQQLAELTKQQTVWLIDSDKSKFYQANVYVRHGVSSNYHIKKYKILKSEIDPNLREKILKDMQRLQATSLFKFDKQ